MNLRAASRKWYGISNSDKCLVEMYSDLSAQRELASEIQATKAALSIGEGDGRMAGAEQATLSSVMADAVRHHAAWSKKFECCAAVVRAQPNVQ